MADESKQINIKIVSSAQSSGTANLPSVGNNPPAQIPAASVPPAEAPSKQALSDAAKKTTARKKSSKSPAKKTATRKKKSSAATKKAKAKARKNRRKALLRRRRKARRRRNARQAKAANQPVASLISKRQQAWINKRNDPDRRKDTQRRWNKSRRRMRRVQQQAIKTNAQSLARTRRQAQQHANKQATLFNRAMGPGAQRSHQQRLSQYHTAEDMNKALGFGGPQAAGASRALALLGPAAAVATAAIAVLGVAALAAGVAIKQIDEIMKGLVRSASQFHGPLAATVATVEVARLEREMHRASVLGNDLTRFASARGEIAVALDDAITSALKPMMPHIIEATEYLATIANIVAIISEHPAWKIYLDSQAQVIKNHYAQLNAIRHLVNGLDPILTYLEGIWAMGKARQKATIPPDIFKDQQDLLAGRIAPSYAIPILPHRSGGVSTRIIP